MAPRPSSFPSSAALSPSGPHLALLILLLFAPACSSGADTADADSSVHEALPKGRSPSAPLPHHLQTPPPLLPSSSGVDSVSGGDRNHYPRAADDDEGDDGLMKGGEDDNRRGAWGPRKRRGQGGDGRGGEEEGTSTAPRHSCKDLRSKRYISDGFCTSTRPLTEAVCAEKCCGPAPSPNRQRPRSHSRPHKYRPHHSLPASPISLHRSSSNHHLQPWYADYVKVWARGKNDMNSVTAGVPASEDDSEDDEDDTDHDEDEGGGAVEWRCVEDAVRRRRVRLLCRDGTRRTYTVRLVKSCKCVQRSRRRRRRGRRKGRRRLGRVGGWAGRRVERAAEE